MRAAGTAVVDGTDVVVSRLGLGAGTLAHADGAAALAGTLDRGADRGLRYVDTAPLYLGGGSEEHVGAWVAKRPRASVTLSTKVGRLADGADGTRRFDYSAAGVRHSLAASMKRLGVDRLDAVFVHDVDEDKHGDLFEERYAQLVEEAWPALEELRTAGIVGALGISTREPAVGVRVVRDVRPDALMMAGSYTLLAHEPARVLLPQCLAAGVSVFVASPFNTGILATGDPDATFDYGPAPADVRARLAGLLAAGHRHGVPLVAAALQYPLRHPAVVSVVAGHRTPAELDANAAALDVEIPEGYWEDLRDAELIPAEVGA